MSSRRYTSEIATNNYTANGSYIDDSILRRNKAYVFWYVNVVNLFITLFIPLALLVYLNVRIWKKMDDFKTRRQRRKENMDRDVNNSYSPSQDDCNEQSLIVVGLIMIFIFCHTLRGILNAQELFYFDWSAHDIENGCYGVKFWAMTLVPISEVMILINSCANFFLHYLFHKDFRAVFMKQKSGLHCGFKQKTKPFQLE